jgi:hypothetical protein
MAKEVVSGIHKPDKTWDGMHKFGSGDGTWAGLHGWIQFGTIGSGKIPKALQAFYKKYNLNPCITSVKFTVDPAKWTIDYEFTIEESPDGNAYVGFSSWGGATGGFPTKNKPSGHAYSNYKKEYDAAISKIKDTKVAHVIDFHFPGGFRQIFFQHTWPQKYPNLAKSPGLKEGTVGVTIGPSGSPKNLPEYDGVLVQTTSVGASPNDASTSDASQSNDQNTKDQSNNQAKIDKTAKEPRLVNSKITLQKVSGPGEIVGITELDLNQGQVTFSGLQFTEPGTYVIAAIGSSTQIERTEFTIVVEPSEEIVEQESTGQEEPTAGTRPIIAQIDEPTVPLPAMTSAASDTQPDNNMTTNLGFVPFLYYGEAQIRPSDIQKLSIFYDEFVPKCVITFTDTLGLVNSPDTSPTANSTIQIFLNSGSDQLKSLHLKFLIDQKKDNKNGTITIFGKLDLKDFYKIGFSSYSGTSFEVLRTISKELRLGYNSNIVETNDTMKWVRNGVNLETFIRSIISKSYISDDSFMVGYIDYYYCFNYVDVEKEYNRDNKTDVGIISQGITSLNNDPDESRTSKLYLTNDKAANNTPFWFNRFTFINNSTNQITRQGVTTDSKVYDRNNKSFLVFNVDSLSSQDDTLKTLRSEDDINTNFKTEFTGKIDTDNVHENYLYAETQNRRNLTNLGNIMADLVLPIPNFNIYKFQKIRVVFTNDKATPSEPDLIMTRYTGDWIIIDISFTYAKSALYQTVRIARKELTKTQKEIETQTTKQDNTQNSEINDNPVIEPTPVIPNSIYEVGQEVYIEQDGKMYIVIVDSLSTDGQEISGKIKKSPVGLPIEYTTVTPGPSTPGLTPSGLTPSTPVGDPNFKAVLVTSLGIYSPNGPVITATAPFLINDKKEVIGTGTASLPPEGIGKQKEMALKAAEIDAINKYKAEGGN